MQTPVILSGANASQSEAFAEPKDPLPDCSVTCSARSLYYAYAVRIGYWQLGTDL